MGGGLLVRGLYSSLSSEDSLLLIKLLPDLPFPLFGPGNVKCFHPEEQNNTPSGGLDHPVLRPREDEK